MAKSYRPGDIVLARVINLGDSHTSYNLATDDDALGYIYHLRPSFVSQKINVYA